MEDKIIYREESYAIQGAVFEVYREMGYGFLEAVYQECMERELKRTGIPFLSQSALQLFFKGEPLRQNYKPDLVCFGKIIVELKAVKAFTAEHEAQMLNYLKATGMQLGLLINFGSHPKAVVKRFVF